MRRVALEVALAGFVCVVLYAVVSVLLACYVMADASAEALREIRKEMKERNHAGH